MATTGRNAKSTSRSTKNSRSSSRPSTRSVPPSERRVPARRDDADRIVCIVLFALSVLLFFIAVIEGEGAWLALHNFYVGVFGYLSAVLLPLILIAVNIISALRRPAVSVIVAKSIESFLMVLFLSAFVHVLLNSSGDAFKSAVFAAYYDAPQTFNGGFVGAVLGWLLLSCGKAPAIIIDLVLIFVDFMLLTGITLLQFFKGVGKPAVKTKEKVAPILEERREMRRSRFNVDVALDKVPPAGLGEGGENAGTKKGRKKQDTQETAAPADDTFRAEQDLIDAINASSAEKYKARMQQENTPEKGRKTRAEKTLDEIVGAASAADAAGDVPKTAKAETVEKLDVPDDAMHTEAADYIFPSVDLLHPAKSASNKDISSELKDNAEKLIDALHSFNVDAKITDISRGPTVTRYELKPAPGIRISKITNLADDIALNLAATTIRIEAPIPGKSAVGIEVPNHVKNMVSMRELIDTYEFEQKPSKLTFGLGKDIAGKCIYADLAKMPHLLIAGTTGSGKSVCMNSIIVSILYKARPDEVKFLMIDPKKVEFSKYSGIPHLLVPVVTEPRKAAGALGWAVTEMLQRYQKFSDTGVRDIEGYNKYAAKAGNMEPMPKVVIFIDELSDLMMAAPKEVEDSICRLAQMARAAGMHLVIATQRPSVDVITGLIKANISSRIALAVSSQIDSRTILDSAGAEKLLGHGDMLFDPVGASKPLRVQGCFISDEEVEALCDFIKNETSSEYSEEIQKEIEKNAVADKKSSPFLDDDEPGEKLDDLFEKAVDVVLESQKASTSFLQRRLGVGYARGAKIMDQLQDKGIIGPPDGSKPRAILINRQQWLEMQAYSGAEPPVEQVTLEDSREDGGSDGEA